MTAISLNLPPAQRLSLVMGLSVAALFLSVMPASADVGDVICNAVRLATQGSLGRGMATLGVLMLGVGAMFGKVSYGLAVTVAVGIAVMFSAPSITYYVTNGASGVSCT